MRRPFWSGLGQRTGIWGGQATIGHMREALTASGGLPFEPGHLPDGPTGMSAGSLTR